MIPLSLFGILPELNLPAVTLAAIAAGLGGVLYLLTRMPAAVGNGIGRFCNTLGGGLKWLVVLAVWLGGLIASAEVVLFLAPISITLAIIFTIFMLFVGLMFLRSVGG